MQSSGETMSDASSLQGPETESGDESSLSPGGSAADSVPRAQHAMSPKSYSELVTSVKEALHREPEADFEDAGVAETFAIALEETSICISQGFSVISTLIDEGDTSDMVHCVENATDILHLLSKYFKETLETVTMTCTVFPTFPTVSANVILNVFVHCMDSELLYSSYLSLVEKPLKELFRSGHELQLVYLMIMEKHFIFDLAEKLDRAVLCEALNTNIKIGEAAIKLDIKTMAEQWKAFTVLCEKYSGQLSGSGVAGRSIDALADVMLENIRCNVVQQQEQRAVLRSLKVTSFLMKIVIKICQLFKSYVADNYTKIVLLLVTIKGYCDIYLRTLNKPEQLIQQVGSHVTVSAEPLLNELLDEEAFAVTVMSYSVESEEEVLTLGYMLLLVSVMSAVIRTDNSASRHLWLGPSPQRNVVCCVLRLVSKSHIWLNYGFQLECWVKKSEAARRYGLYERLLSSAGALAATAAPEQYPALEAGLLRALLGEDCWAGLFAGDLWLILARFGSTDLCIEHIIILIDIYKRLKATVGISNSPQSIHLSKTIGRLFNTLPEEDKLKIINEFSITDQNNAFVIGVLGVRNLPEKQVNTASNTCFNNLRKDLSDFIIGTQCDIYMMIDNIKLAATCPAPAPAAAALAPAGDVVRTWLKLYINRATSIFLTKEETTIHGRQFFTELVIAMGSLTESMIKTAQFDNKQLIQILDVLQSIIANSSSALRFSAITVISSLAFYSIPNDAHAGGLCALIVKLFQSLLSDEDPIVKSKALIAFRNFSLYTNNENIIPCTVTEDLKETVISFMKTGEFENSEVKRMEQLKNTSQMRFQHKCKYLVSDALDGDGLLRIASDVMHDDSEDICAFNSKELSCSNFEITDIEDLFENSEIEESQSKKIKLNTDELGSILSSIENNVFMLKNIKENITKDHKVRISNISDALKNIIS